MPRLAATGCVFAFVLAALGVPAAASAQDTSAQLQMDRGMDLHLFRPAIDSKGHLTVNGTDILGDGDFSFGLILDGGFGILPYEGFVDDDTVSAAEAERTERIVDQFFTGTLHFNYGFANTLVAGIQVPIQVVNGPAVAVPGVYNGTGMTGDRVLGLDYQGLGNITLHGKVRLLRSERDPVGLAAILHIELPTGDSTQFAGEPGFAVWPVVALEWRPVRALRFGFNLGYRFNAGEGADFPVGGRTEPDPSQPSAIRAMITEAGSDFSYDDLITFGAGLSIRLGDSIDLVGEVYGTQILASIGEGGALNAEALGGLKIFVQANSYLVLAGGIGIPTGGAQAADVRGMLGFIFEPSIGDRDGDGLRDDVDQCPDEPEDFDNFADEDGCPEPDNDRDGILDVDDECPLVPEDRDGDADDDGCPEGNEGDRDGDGIPDATDECPDDPEDRDGFQDEEGCPDPDNDQDGILDPDDLCPNDPEDRDGFQDEDGCPDPDNDQDRILDVNDSCPNDPETYNGFEDEDGCPDRGSVVIEENQIVILEKIYFETDSAQIQQRSFPIIDAVAATLNGNPQITLVEIQGHADERATDDYNIRLTRDRAASVLEALVQRGVERGRLRSGGYGERCPVDPRHNNEAWERNRRVEFKIINTDQGPTGVEVACPAGRELIPE